MKYRISRSVYGTKKFYWNFKKGNLGEYWRNPTYGYGELQKMDPKLEFEGTLYLFYFSHYFKKTSLFVFFFSNTYTQRHALLSHKFIKEKFCI